VVTAPCELVVGTVVVVVEAEPEVVEAEPEVVEVFGSEDAVETAVSRPEVAAA
jgi:hypothetical protein